MTSTESKISYLEIFLKINFLVLSILPMVYLILYTVFELTKYYFIIIQKNIPEDLNHFLLINYLVSNPINLMN